jgi:hypothetical protein
MTDKVEEAKRKAAYQAIDDWVTVWQWPVSPRHQAVACSSFHLQGGEL